MKRKKAKGLRAKCPFSFLLPPVKQRRGSRAPAAPGPAALGHGGRREQGKRGRTTRGFHPPPRFGPGRGEAAAPRRPAGGCAMAAALWGVAAARKWGEREREPRGFYPPHYLGLRRLVEAARRRWADGGRWCRGGGAAS